jgi:hypothetical protein
MVCIVMVLLLLVLLSLSCLLTSAWRKRWWLPCLICRLCSLVSLCVRVWIYSWPHICGLVRLALEWGMLPLLPYRCMLQRRMDTICWSSVRGHIVLSMNSGRDIGRWLLVWNVICLGLRTHGWSTRGRA